MLYYYVNTGHKIGLERLRRGASILKKITSKGVSAQLLVNDFRAGLIAKELGVTEYITIETIQDIDAIATIGDSIIIDSIEDDHGRLVKYCADFKNVWRFAHDENDIKIHTENLLDIDTISIDITYLENRLKEDRVLFFLGDSDYNKTILNNKDFFEQIEMELLLGNYFFVKYENDLSKIFSQLHEPEEYENLIKSSSIIITSSSQTALEAKMSGSRVIFLDISLETIYTKNLLKSYNIEIVNGFDSQKIKDLLNETPKEEKINLIEVDVNSLIPQK